MTIQNTTRFQFPYPQLVESAHVPRDVQALADRMEAVLNQLIPIGALHLWTTAASPVGWVVCDGSQVDRAGTYAALFAVIGTTYNFGTVPGTKFCLPDFRGRTAVGSGTSDASGATAQLLGAKAGKQTHLLAKDESGLRDHSHGGTTGNEKTSLSHAHAAVFTGGQNSDQFAHWTPGDVRTADRGAPGAGGIELPTYRTSANTANGGPPAHAHDFSTSSLSVTGGQAAAQAHENMQPSQVVNYIIRYA